MDSITDFTGSRTSYGELRTDAPNGLGCFVYDRNRAEVAIGQDNLDEYFDAEELMQ